jgi:hypothetical protein
MNNLQRLKALLIITVSVMMLSSAMVGASDSALLIHELATLAIKPKDFVEVKQDNVDIVEKRLRTYNPKVTRETALQVERAIVLYDLEPWRKNLTSQLCLESTASHFDSKGRVKEGRSQDMGIAQITPPTAFHFLRSTMTDEDRRTMEKAGATDLTWIESIDYRTVDGKTVIPSAGKAKAKEWLKNEKNNILLWGYIMGSYREKFNTFERAAVAYNKGQGGLNIVEREMNASDHIYARHVQRINKKISDLSS